MKPAAKVGIVLGGYLAALVIASLVLYLRVKYTSTLPDGSGGMYAFGDSIIFVFVLGIASLVPTGFGLYFLRQVRWFWMVIASLSLLLALTAAGSAILYWTVRSQPPAGSFLTVAAALSVERLIVAPLFFLGYLLIACFAPSKGVRWALASAAAIECVAAVPWFVFLAASSGVFG